MDLEDYPDHLAAGALAAAIAAVLERWEPVDRGVIDTLRKAADALSVFSMRARNDADRDGLAQLAQDCHDAALAVARRYTIRDRD